MAAGVVTHSISKGLHTMLSLESGGKAASAETQCMTNKVALGLERMRVNLAQRLFWVSVVVDEWL